MISNTGYPPQHFRLMKKLYSNMQESICGRALLCFIIRPITNREVIMKSHWIFVLAISFIGVLALTVCGAPQPVVTTNLGAIPSSLVTIEAAAEDIIDFAPSG